MTRAPLRVWLRWRLAALGYLIRPFDQLADRRRWAWQRRTACRPLVVTQHTHDPLADLAHALHDRRVSDQARTMFAPWWQPWARCVAYTSVYHPPKPGWTMRRCGFRRHAHGRHAYGLGHNVVWFDTAEEGTP